MVMASKETFRLTTEPALPSSRSLPLILRTPTRTSLTKHLSMAGPNSYRSNEETTAKTRFKVNTRKLKRRTREISEIDLQEHQVKLGLIDTYRNLSTLTRQEPISRKTIPELPYFTEIQRKRLKPELTVFTKKQSLTHINFQDYSLGDDYAAAVSIAISNNPFLETLNFKNNRLRESGSLRIIESLQFGRVKELNLSENDIGEKGFQALSVLIKKSKILEILSLEKAIQMRKHLNMILEAVTGNQSLTRLSLARNRIGNGSGSEFYVLLTTNATLQHLDLHWNTIGGPAAVQLFKGLKENRSLQELDMSWNSLGNDPSLEICKALCRVFGENEVLKHLDVSYNYFTYAECERLADGIKCNHTILGIHMAGNNCDVDSQGYLHPLASMGRDMEAHTLQRTLSPRACKASISTSCNCWLCEKWVTVTFEWNFKAVVWNRRLKHFSQEHKENREPVFLHLDIDGFEPQLLNKQEDGCYRLTRAVPSIGVKFFFTYRGYAQVSFAYSLFHVSDPKPIEVSFFASISKHYSLVLLNQYQPDDSPCSLDETFPVLPRPGPWAYEAEPAECPAILPEWSIENSIFRTYKFDNEKLVKECMDSDWANSRLNSLIKSEIERTAVKTVLLQIYDKLKEAFRLLCNFEKFSVSKMTLSSLTDLVNRMSIFDNKDFRVADLDLNVRASLMEGSGQHIAAINRTEFIETVVRVALDKYLIANIGETESMALSRFAAEHVQPVLKFDSNKWRYERYLNEDVDLVYTNNLDTLQRVFARYSGKYSQGGEKPWMSVEEFIQCCKALSLTCKSSSRLYSLCYQLSLMTHKDLAHSKRQYQMCFVEFLEAIARVADFKDLEEPDEAITQGLWSEEHLDEKLELILLHAAKQLRTNNL